MGSIPSWVILKTLKIVLSAEFQYSQWYYCMVPSAPSGDGSNLETYFTSFRTQGTLGLKSGMQHQKSLRILLQLTNFKIEHRKERAPSLNVVIWPLDVGFHQPVTPKDNGIIRKVEDNSFLLMGIAQHMIRFPAMQASIRNFLTLLLLCGQVIEI